MIFLEINEFSSDLMATAAEALNAPNIKKLLQLKHTTTTTDDQFERFGLDPWVQWVSIHTGQTSSEHGVRHLGDVPKLDHPQIWEVLSKKGFSSGVWGAMNASRASAENCQFFFPDPWSFSEDAYPPQLNNLLAFPRYYSKNYGDLNKGKTVRTLAKLIYFCLNPGVASALLPVAPKIISHVIKYGMPEYLLFVLFDLVNARLFAHYSKKSKPKFSLLFLNSIAHLQHHKWTSKNGLSEEMKIAFLLLDDILGTVFNVIPVDEPIIVANAFSQYCSFDQNEFLYRQKNPEKFLRTCGIEFERVEQAMTNDGHVFFDSRESAQEAIATLHGATVNGKKLFDVEYDESTPKQLFFQIILWDQLDSHALLSINGRSMPFFDLFDQVTQRSGSHLQIGDIFSRGMDFPDKIMNHELSNYIVGKFVHQTVPA